MKKILLPITVLFVFLFALSAQTTQEQADAIVSERLSQETLPYIVSAKEGLQPEMTITSNNGELLELDYPCWVYYVSYPTVNCCLGRYLIVNESNGNLLEVNAKGNAMPKDLAKWRVVEKHYPITIKMTSFSLPTGCAWDNLASDSLYLINSREELAQHLACWANVILDVDLDRYTLMVLKPKYCNIESKVEKLLLKQLSADKYLLYVDVLPSTTAIAAPLIISVLAPKIAETASVELDISTEDYVEGYIVGTFVGTGTFVDSVFYEDLTPRGYCIKLIGSNNSKMSFYTFSLADPSEVITHGISNSSNCGPVFFSNDYKKIKFKYKIAENKLDFDIGPCTTMVPQFPWDIYDEVVVYDVIAEIEENVAPFSASEMTTSINHFSMNFFATAYEELSSDENIVLSPLSLNMALAMVWNGANGETRQGIQQAMGMQNYSQAEVNSYFLNLRNDLITADPNVKLTLANSIWYDNGFPVKNDFIAANKDYYDAEVNEIDFRAPEAPDQINQWCSDNTNGLIKEMITEIPSDVMMYLINALYFKGLWTDSCGFDSEYTHPTYFYKENGEKILIDMMSQSRKDIEYYSDNRLEMVSLPYGNGAYSMIFALPKGNFGDMPVQLKENGYWQKCLSNLKPQIAFLSIPKFKVEYEPEPDLNKILIKLGMEKAFTAFADFSGISDAGLFISQVRQKTYIEVDEKGTEAAAITMIGMPNGEGPTYPSFYANRPFLFVIQENTTGTALFMGKIGSPK